GAGAGCDGKGAGRAGDGAGGRARGGERARLAVAAVSRPTGGHGAGAVTTVQHLEATPAHAACLSAIHAASVRPGEPVWEAMAFETLIARTGARALLAADGGDPAGFVLWRTAADEA